MSRFESLLKKWANLLINFNKFIQYFESLYGYIILLKFWVKILSFSCIVLKILWNVLPHKPALERSPRNSTCARSAHFILRHARFHSRSRDFRVNTNQDREFKRFYYDLDHFHKTIRPCAFTQRIIKYRESFYSTYDSMRRVIE